MKISYRREMKHNYLIIDPEEVTWRNYECKMLSGNTIHGILQFQLRQIDDEVRFYYEITSRQPLSRILENHLLRETEIRRIILGISGVLDRMEQYLLRENSVLLEQDYIYVNPEDFQIWLCLVPGLERDFPYDYGKLLEYLLGKINHQDKDSVILAYGLYQETRKENYGMEDILRLLGSEKRAQEACEEECGTRRRYDDLQQNTHWQAETADRVKTEVPQKKVQQIAQQGAKRDWDVRKAAKLENEKKEIAEDANRIKRPKIWSRIIACWKNRKHKQEKSAYNADDVVWEQLFRDDLSNEQDLSDEVGVCGLETKKGEEATVMQGRNTTLLADLSSNEDSNSRKLRALDSGFEDIRIPYYPFVIGKQEHLADYYLNHETVSRLHVRIDETDNGWLIQDLNSSNGTMVAGRLLENNEAAPLHLNDEVRIADLRYQFV